LLHKKSFFVAFLQSNLHHFSKILDFACAEQKQNQGFWNNGEGIILRDLQENKIPIFEREGWLYQPSLSKMGILLSRRSLSTWLEIKLWRGAHLTIALFMATHFISFIFSYGSLSILIS